MPLSREQAQALTRLTHLLRPAWSEEGIYAALSKCRELDAHETALAAIRAAADKTAKTPGVIPARGSHWNEPDPGPRTPPRLTREQRRAKTCAECGALDGCRPPAHEFVPLDQAARNRNPEGVAAVRAAFTEAAAVLCGHGVDRNRVKCAECERPAPKPEPEAETAETTDERDDDE